LTTSLPVTRPRSITWLGSAPNTPPLREPAPAEWPYPRLPPSEVARPAPTRQPGQCSPSVGGALRPHNTPLAALGLAGEVRWCSAYGPSTYKASLLLTVEEAPAKLRKAFAVVADGMADSLDGTTGELYLELAIGNRLEIPLRGSLSWRWTPSTPSGCPARCAPSGAPTAGAPSETRGRREPAIARTRSWSRLGL
jgi:hypothetical protein